MNSRRNDAMTDHRFAIRLPPLLFAAIGTASAAAPAL
jgi:hypothetical protein